MKREHWLPRIRAYLARTLPSVPADKRRQFVLHVLAALQPPSELADENDILAAAMIDRLVHHAAVIALSISRNASRTMVDAVIRRSFLPVFAVCRPMLR